MITSLTNVTVGVPSQLSDAVTDPGSGSGTSPAHSTVISKGQVIEGGTPSTSVNVWLAVEAFPQVSVAVQIRVIVPPAQFAIVSLESTDVITTVKSQLSVAVGVPKGGVASQASVISGGTKVNTGATISTKVSV